MSWQSSHLKGGEVAQLLIQELIELLLGRANHKPNLGIQEPDGKGGFDVDPLIVRDQQHGSTALNLHLLQHTRLATIAND
jgi:hypothetical protein